MSNETATPATDVAELWALRRPDGGFVPPMDDDGTGVFMVWPSKDEAEQGMVHQQANYELFDVEVVRVK